MVRPKVRRWTVLLAPCAVIVAALAVGVGSSSARSSGSVRSTVAKGKPVLHVFGYGIETNPAAGALFPAATYVATEPQLAVKAIDADPSRPVRLTYTFCDTKLSASGSIACAKQAGSPTGCGGARCDVALDTIDLYDNLSVPLLRKEGLPVVSAVTNSAQAADTPGNFGLTTDATGVLQGLGYLMWNLGAHRVGIVNLIGPSSQAEDNATSMALTHFGLTVSGVTDLQSFTAPQNTGINTVMTGGADGLIDAAPGPVGAGINYAEQTFPGVKIGLPVSVVSSAAFTGLPLSVTNGIGVVGNVQPVTATKVPGIKMFIAEGGLTASTPTYRGQDFPTTDWLAARFIANVADTITGSITQKSMLHALSTAKNVDMYGIVPPWSAANRGKNGAGPNTPYNVVVDERLQNLQQVAVTPGIFESAASGTVAYVDPGLKKQ